MVSFDELEELKNEYPRGTRIVLVDMCDDYLNSGERGTVCGVDAEGDISVFWDNGSNWFLSPNFDLFRKLTSDELEQERLLAEYEDSCITG